MVMHNVTAEAHNSEYYQTRSQQEREKRKYYKINDRT
jgi:hypothetical protein